MTVPSGDFLDLLKKNGYELHSDSSGLERVSKEANLELTEGTTVVAVRYKDGVMIAGDRRATAGNTVMYDRADKVLELDEYSVIAVAGSPAIAYEIARTLEHSFQYFRRSQLQELSLEGKLRMLSRLIRENFPMAMQGAGVIPILAIYDPQSGDDGGGKIFFYDALGAQFEVSDFATSGSGSVWIRGVLYHLNRWGKIPLANMNENQAITNIMKLLETASEYDAATGGYNSRSSIFPTIKTITSNGIADLQTEKLRQIYEKSVEVKLA